MFKVIDKSIIYKDDRLSFIKDSVINKKNCHQSFTYITKKDAVLIIAEVNDSIIFVKQSRYLSKKISFELPGGTIEKGEKPIDAAFRELEEETGYKNPKIIRYLGSFYPLLSITNEKNYIFFMSNMEQGKINHDTTEFDLSHHLVKIKDLNQIIEKEMVSGPDILALLIYKNFKTLRGVNYVE